MISSSSQTRYQRVNITSSSRRTNNTCEHCGVTFSNCLNWRCPCKRCESIYCRKCFASTSCFCVSVVPLFVLLPFRNWQDVCDSCLREATREAAFIRHHMLLLTRGEVVTIVKPNLLGVITSSSYVPCWLTLHSASRRFKYSSLQLSEQIPTLSGQLKIDDIAGVQTGTAAAAGAGLPPASASVSASYPVRLINAKGQSLLLFTCTDASHMQRWADAINELVACVAMSYTTVFPRGNVDSSSDNDVRIKTSSPPGGGGGGGGGGGKGGAGAGGGGGSATSTSLSGESLADAKEARAAELSRRQAEREAFRARLGDVGMQHTARIMAARAVATSITSQQQQQLQQSSSSSSFSLSSTEAARPPGGGSGANSVSGKTATGGSGGGSSPSITPLQGSTTLVFPPSLRSLGSTSSRALGTFMNAVSKPPLSSSSLSSSSAAGASSSGNSSVSSSRRPSMLSLVSSSGAGGPNTTGGSETGNGKGGGRGRLGGSGVGAGIAFGTSLSAMRAGLGNVARTVSAKLDSSSASSK